MKSKLLLILLIFFNTTLNAGIFDFLDKKIKEKVYKEETNINNDTKENKNLNNINIKNDNNNVSNNINNNIQKIKKEKIISSQEKNNIKEEIFNKSDNINNKKINNIKKEEKIIQQTEIKDKIKKILNLKTSNTSLKEKKIKENSFNKDKSILSLFNKTNNKPINLKNIKKQVIEYKLLIDKYLYKRNYKEVFKILNSKILNNEYVSKKLKMKFLDYIFWQILEEDYEKYNIISVKQKEKLISLLSKVVDKMDINYNINIILDVHLFNILTEELSAGSKFKIFLSKYYPYGINDKDLYIKLFKFFSSDFLRDNVYKNPVVIYLKKDFLNYFNRNMTLNEELLDTFLKMLVKNNLFSGNSIFNVIKKYKYLNPLSSDVYYYYAIYYGEDSGKIYEKYLKLAIKYNIYNIQAWKALVEYYINNRSKEFENLKNKEKIFEYDKRILKIINYISNNIILNDNDNKFFLLKKAKIYYLEGTYFKKEKYLIKAKEIYAKLNKFDIVKQIDKYINLIKEN